MTINCGVCKFYRSTSPRGTCHKLPPVRLPRKFEQDATAGNRVRDETLLWGFPEPPEGAADWCGSYESRYKDDPYAV